MPSRDAVIVLKLEGELMSRTCCGGSETSLLLVVVLACRANLRNSDTHGTIDEAPRCTLQQVLKV
jgi:hypothetical protein